MKSTKVFINCRRHKRQLRALGSPIFVELVNGGFDLNWGLMQCPVGDRKCESKWRVVIVDKEPL